MDLVHILLFLYQITHIPFGLFQQKNLVIYQPEREIMRTVSEHAFVFITDAASDNGIQIQEISHDIHFTFMTVPHQSVSVLLGPVHTLPVSYPIARTAIQTVGASPESAGEFLTMLQELPASSLPNLAKTSSFLYNLVSGSDIYYQELLPDAVWLRQSRDLSATQAKLFHGNESYSKTLYAFIQYGQPEKLKEFLNAPVDYGKPAYLSSNPRLQNQYMMIHSMTLAEQAAIRGGVSYELAVSIFEQYAQQVEKTENIDVLWQIYTNMLLRFARLVSECGTNMGKTLLVRQISSYIQEHLYERLTVRQIADALQMNQSYISTAFRRETGMTIKEYILRQKTEEGKRLLTTTRDSISQISTELHFPSQAYFATVFRKYTGMSPTEFRSSGEEDTYF